MAGTQVGTGATECGCAVSGGSASEPEETRGSHSVPEPRLEDLIPIAVVITAGCESCAERMVWRALEQGSSPSHIQKALGVVAHLQKLDCLAQAVGTEVVARMERPLAAGRKTLQEAKARWNG